MTLTRLDPHSRCDYCKRSGVWTPHCGTNKAPTRCKRLPKGGVTEAPPPDKNVIVRRCSKCRAAGLSDGVCGTSLASPECRVVHGLPTKKCIADERCKACYFANGSKTKCSTKAAAAYCLFEPGFLRSVEATTADGGGASQ